MKRILSKDQVVKIVESIKYKVGDTIFIHHPITEDLMTVKVKELKKDKILVSVPETSPYLGQPDWYIPKVNIIGIKAIQENQSKDIPVIIPNWKDFQKQFSEYHAENPKDYKNPMQIWKELCAEVTKRFESDKKLPDYLSVCYKTHFSDMDACFSLVPADKPTYEYIGIAG